MIGYSRTTKRIVTREAYARGQLIGAQHDGSREWITLLACISAAGGRLSPALIYQGDSYDLQSTWIEDVLPEDQVYFGSSENGWSSNAHGMAWLKQIFNLQTKDIAGNRRRLLLADGHSSHVNLEFINYCDQNRILLLILPLHTTHRLQPLDIGLFQPLSTAYSAELDNITAKSAGIVSMKKRMFWSVFKPAWDASFTLKNIINAFAKPGIWPINPDVVLSKLQPIKTSTPALDLQTMSNSTPISCRAIRNIQKSYKKSPTAQKLERIFYVMNRLASEHSIDAHVNQGLR